MQTVEKLKFLTRQDVVAIAEGWGTPVWVYDEATLRHQAETMLAIPAPFGLEVRYAMKANPHSYILQLFHQLGVGIDASSGFEAERAILIGYEPSKILITSQELPHNLKELVEQGVQFNACSLHQLREYGRLFPGGSVGVRINPGVGSGSTKRVNVGGASSSFGIWHEYIDEILAIAKECNLTINRLHTHIGSGTDPNVWMDVAVHSLKELDRFPDVTIINLGGGFKVGRMANETSTDMKEVGPALGKVIQDFYEETGRKLKLEVEPGTFLVANAGALVARIQDIVDTGKDGYTFLKVDTGMTEIFRPNAYDGIYHPIVVVNDGREEYAEYVVVGHCCESGDLLTPPKESDGDAIVAPRILQKASIGDLAVIEGAGAYCAGMSAHNYNSFPRVPAVVKAVDGSFVGVSRRETVADMIRLESTAADAAAS